MMRIGFPALSKNRVAWLEKTSVKFVVEARTVDDARVRPAVGGGLRTRCERRCGQRERQQEADYKNKLGA